MSATPYRATIEHVGSAPRWGRSGRSGLRSGIDSSSPKRRSQRKPGPSLSKLRGARGSGLMDLGDDVALEVGDAYGDQVLRVIMINPREEVGGQLAGGLEGGLDRG